MDLVLSLSHALSLRWAVSGRVDQGGEYCIAQGVLLQFGNTGTAISALLVVLLVVGYYRRVKGIEENPGTVSCCLLAFLITFLITLIVPPVSVISNLYGNTGLWCWIVHSDPLNSGLQLGTCYGLMWLVALTSFLGYGYVLMGTLNNPNPKIQEGSDSIILPSYTVEEAWGMMWYSLAYVFEVTPISVIRLVQFGTKGPCPGVGPGWLIFAIPLYSASGLINTILWLTTGRRFGFSTEQERRRTNGPQRP
ncbi:uncharacterized protein EI90DRAFT_3096227 [Cantharellus anzutake]|uniref:uncharacterized protein n=1 Tax=Cantharellus anzutake TaxID=1750568 RepID=UPI0019055B3F|nr:uncharacterized protein EI90DRAFT_3096227 [Cantharellus anzutake]KAF8311537.1 hypothetical protein EI90DRAFT_3096227 [Cantharellus anzutake]